MSITLIVTLCIVFYITMGLVGVFAGSLIGEINSSEDVALMIPLWPILLIIFACWCVIRLGDAVRNYALNFKNKR